jgi:hypothetical protein
VTTLALNVYEKFQRVGVENGRRGVPPDSVDPGAFALVSVLLLRVPSILTVLQIGTRTFRAQNHCVFSLK